VVRFKEIHREVDRQSRNCYLDAMGITGWVLSQERQPADDEYIGEDQAGIAGEAPRQFQDVQDLSSIEIAVRGCKACVLHQSRSNTVFGSGSLTATWFLVGEAPGAEEDKQGLPFVGRAGQLLDSMLYGLGLNRDEVYVANVLKCRPPRNRDPMGDEVGKCEPYLHQQIRNIQPKIVIAMGRFAAQSLLKKTDPISRLRGRVHEYEKFGIPLVVTYHPAYLLRSPLEKRKAWADLAFARAILENHG